MVRVFHFLGEIGTELSRQRRLRAVTFEPNPGLDLYPKY